MSKTNKFIDEKSSIFLDTLRILASLTVFYFHAYDQWNKLAENQEHSVLYNVAHGAVIVFFVLSGYVIAYTTTNRNRGEIQYASARLGRLYSVLVPALFITALLTVIAKYFDPNLMNSYSRGETWPRLFVSAFFLNEVWFLSAAPPINGPLWSLSFEFWYYVIFGLFLYRNNNWPSYFIIVVACLFAGPKILLLMPVWIFGNLAYHIARIRVNTWPIWLLVFTFISIAIFLVILLPLMPFVAGTSPLFFAGQFVTDWAVGLFVALALALLPLAANLPKKEKSKRLYNLYRKFADITFPIYILHFPLLVTFRSIFGTDYFNLSQMWVAIFTTLTLCIVFGLFTEHYRRKWDKLFLNIFSKLKTVNYI